MNNELGISQTAYEFIRLPSEEERIEVAKSVKSQLENCLQLILQELTEKEGRRDKKVYENFMQIYGRDIILLSFRILDELLLKE